MCKKSMVTALLLVFLLTLAPASTALAGNQVQVTLPSFSVSLNGQTTSNDYSKYPLLVYKDITYFPMTYYDCRLLGIKTNWTADTGLVIEKNEDFFYEYIREINDSKNTRQQTAKLADDKITVNGTVIDNSKEEYPLLVFRDVTYFPLTWRFSVNELDWNYKFDQKNGLVIQNDKVKLENPEEWKFTIFKGAGTLGRGSELRIRPFGPYGYDLSGLTDPENDVITISLKDMEKEKKLLQEYGNGELLSVAELKQLESDTLDLPGEIASKISALESVETASVSISDMMPTARNFVDARMKYQIYKKIGAHEELTYQCILPPLNGSIGYTNFADYQFVIKFWLAPSLTTGTYKIHIDRPEYFNCYENSSNEISQYDTSEINFCDDYLIKIVD